MRAAWYALDESDNDTAQFMAYLYAALETLCDQRAEWQELRALLHVTPLPAPDTLLSAAINLLYAEPALVPRLLVLEDYHVIQNVEIHRALAFWLDHAPPGLHLVITSRADPPLPLSRLRARMQLTEVRAADLRFTYDEAAAFLQTTMGLHLTAAQIEMLEQKTEGWVAGLQLAALSLQKDADADAMLRAFTGTHRYIMDYLLEEVLQREPEPIQTFLLHASLLERFNAALCDAVISESDNASAQLDYLERRNLFIVPLDERREWYRFHQLFAQVLQQRLRRLSPDMVPQLYVRASEWFQAQALLPEAIHYALAAQDFDRAARLIQANAKAMLYQGTRATLQRWLDALPDAVLDAHPALWLSRAETFVISQDLYRADNALARVEQLLPQIQDPALAQTLSGESAAIGAKIALNRNEVARTLQLGQQALDTLDETEFLMRSAVWLHMGVAYDWDGQLERALECFRHARQLGEQAQDASATVLAIANYGAAEKTRAAYRRAAEIYQQGIQTEAPYNASYLPAAVYLYTDLAELHYEWNDLEGARRQIDQAIERSELLGLTRARVVSYRILARWLQANGKFVQAQDMLTQALQLAQEHQIPSHYASPARAVQVYLWLDTGNLMRAVEWATRSGLETDTSIDKPRQEEYLALARVYLAQNEAQRARAVLERLLADAENGGRTECVIWALAHLALAHHAQHDFERARAVLTRALELAKPPGFVRTFLDLGAPMHQILQQAASTAAPPLRAYVESLVANNAAIPATSQPSAAPERPETTELVEELTEREKQVLELVAQGLSDKQIATQLIVATGTVKRHLNNIYGKLGVNSRTQALARARQVGWIP
jgi:LuxR family maltose regulon positive regulatory protein